MESYKNKDILQELYDELGSCKKVAERLGCNTKTVNIWANKLEVKIKERFKGANKKHHFNESFFSSIDTEQKAYWLGFVYADGCVYKGSSCNSYRLQINLKHADKYHLESFQKAIGSNYKIQDKNVNGSMSSLLKINSTKMCIDLMSLGVLPRKSLTLKPPERLKKQLVRHFIRGYFDGDGSIKKTGREKVKYSISFVGTHDFLEWTKKELIESNIHVDTRVSKLRNIWALEYQKMELAEKTFHYLYNDSSIHLERKYNRFLTHLSIVLSESM